MMEEDFQEEKSVHSEICECQACRIGKTKIFFWEKSPESRSASDIFDDFG